MNGISSICNESADRPGGPEYDFGNDRRRRDENFVQKYYIFKEIYILTSMITWVDYIGMCVLRKIFMWEKFALRVSRD